MLDARCSAATYRLLWPRDIFLTFFFAGAAGSEYAFPWAQLSCATRALTFLRSSAVSFLVFAISPFLLCLETFSSCAYFSTNFLIPKRGNCTVIFAVSPSPSRWKTVPSPYFGCFTFCPTRNPVLPVAACSHVERSVE